MNNISYESISKKLGFRPFIDSDGTEMHDWEDDSQKSPYSVLTKEEFDFLFDYLVKMKAAKKN